MTGEQVKTVVEFIVAFLIERTGNDTFDEWKEKRKIKNVLEGDRKNIKKSFRVEYGSDLYNLIEEFIMISAFKETTFYSPVNLTVEQENELWDRFKYHIKSETGDDYVDDRYKEKIIRCVNLHNEKINNIILDSKSRFHIKLMNEQYLNTKNYLNDIITTLNTNTKLQEEDDELNFAVEQLETIIKSYRYDINQLRKIQLLSISGTMIIFLLMGIFVPLSLKDIVNIYPTIIMATFFSMVAILLLIFWGHISKKLRSLENELTYITKIIWELHFEFYKNHITKRYSKEFVKL